LHDRAQVPPSKRLIRKIIKIKELSFSVVKEQFEFNGGAPIRAKGTQHPSLLPVHIAGRDFG
jgi:hypothetical protein